MAGLVAIHVFVADVDAQPRAGHDESNAAR